ncbi:hypothetical protein T484DRAFT_1761484 [Baffinella frigidus]|nr:hypothetical protein T484DRAFT_1761484 [Cryptophyta sp. CCMP2293]
MPSHATRTGMFGPQDDTPWLVGPRDRRASLGVKLHQTPRPTCPSPPMTVHARVLEGVAKPARKTRLLGEQSHLVASPRPESRIIPRSASSSSRTALALVDAPDPQGRRATHLSMRFARLSNKHDLDVWSSTTPRNQDDIETLLHRLRVAASTRTPRHEPAAHGHEEEEAARLLVSSMRSRSLPEHIRSPAPRNVFKVHLRC